MMKMGYTRLFCCKYLWYEPLPIQYVISDTMLLAGTGNVIHVTLSGYLQRSRRRIARSNPSEPNGGRSPDPLDGVRSSRYGAV